MVISSFISSILVLGLGVWAYLKLESSMNIVAEKQLLIEPNRFSYKMWKDMPVTMYQSFTFFNLTNWNQVKAIGQKPRFVEVGPYVYRTVWTKSDINFLDEERLVSFSERKQWIFQQHLSKGSEDDQIWTINTPLMTALALIQNAPVITRNIVSVILDGLGEGAFIKRNIRSLLFEGYSDLIVSVGPLFDRRFANFNGKFAYLYNKNDSIDGTWTVSTGTEDIASLNKITRFQNNIVNMTTFSSGQLPQGLNEVKSECAPAWSLDQATNGQLFAPFNRDAEEIRLQQQLEQLKQSKRDQISARSQDQIPAFITHSPAAPALMHPKRFFSRNAPSSSSSFSNQHTDHSQNAQHHQQSDNLVPNPFINQQQHQQQQNQKNQPQSQQLIDNNNNPNQVSSSTSPLDRVNLKDVGKYIFYPDLCRPIHLLPSKQEITTANGIQATRFLIDPRVFMNSTQVPTNRCFEMNPRPPLANALAATINSVTGTNVAMPLVSGASSPFAIFSSPPSSNNHHHGFPFHNNNNNHHHHHSHHNENNGGLFERSNHPSSFINNALHGFGATIAAANQDQQASSSNQTPISRLGRVRQLFSNIVSQRMSAGPGSLLPSLASSPAGMLMGGNSHFSSSSNARNSPDEPMATANTQGSLSRQPHMSTHNSAGTEARHSSSMSPNILDSAAAQASPNGAGLHHPAHHVAPMASPQVLAPPPLPLPAAPSGGSDRWITQFRFKWPRGVFSIGQCQLGAPIYASLPHFLDADEYYLEQVDGLKPNRSLHEFYIDLESNLHSIPVGAKARLQLNVATPELRFRNIPNAMIPVLWQEVTFEIDKPVATMLYWSFTMSPTIYKLVSILLLIGGTVLLIVSFVGGFKQHSMRRRQERLHSKRRGESKRATTNRSGNEIDGTSSSSSTSSGDSRSSRLSDISQSSPIRTRQEGHSSSWRPRMLIGNHADTSNTSATTTDVSGRTILSSNNNNNTGGVINHAFNLCTEFHERMNEAAAMRQNLSGGSSGPLSISNHSTGSGSPKQPCSRTSSHCELVSSSLIGGANINPMLSSSSSCSTTTTPCASMVTNATTTLGPTTATTCTSCLLACLRNSPAAAAAALAAASSVSGTLLQHNNHNHLQNHQGHNHHYVNQHDHHTSGTSDNSLVIQQTTCTSDSDKATLSSRGSNIDSCSSIYNNNTQQRSSSSSASSTTTTITNIKSKS